MKYILMLFLLILSSFLVSANPLNITLIKEEYSSKETLQTYLGINTLLNEQISINDIQLWQNNVKLEISPFLVRLKEDQIFVYFDLPYLEEGNCSLLIKDLTYLKSGILVKENQTKSFSILNVDSVISLNPAIIKVINFNEDTSYNIVLKNKGSTSVNISLTENYDYIYLSKETFTLNSGEEKSFVVYIDPTLIDSSQEAKIEISYGDKKYDLFVYLDRNGEEEILVPANFSNITINRGQKVAFNVSSDYDKSFDFGEGTQGNILISNFGNESVENIIFSLTGNLDEVVTFNLSRIDLINPGESIKQYVWINKEGNAEPGEYNGNFVLNYSSGSDSWAIKILIKEKANEVDDTNDSDITKKNDTIPIIGNGSNYTTPEDKTTEKSVKVWIIFLIIGVALAIGLFLFFRKRNY